MSNATSRSDRTSAIPFTRGFLLALAAGLVAAAILSPLAACAVAALAMRFPFPRIFDRTVMLMLAAALYLMARRLRLAALLRQGFANPGEGLGLAARGFALGTIAIAALVALAAGFGGHLAGSLNPGLRLANYVAGALAIGIIEEGFFRAFLLAGMEADFGPAGALFASSAVYAVAHIVRSPARFFVTGIDPTIGFRTLAMCFERLLHPWDALPGLLGLFLLGLALGAAFLATRRVYFSIGLHAGLVLGAKLWPFASGPAAGVPRLIAGFGSPPLISGPAAWALAIAIIALTPILRRRSSRPAQDASAQR